MFSLRTSKDNMIQSQWASPTCLPVLREILLSASLIVLPSPSNSSRFALTSVLAFGITASALSE